MYARTKALGISQLISKLKHNNHLNNRNLRVLYFGKNDYEKMK